MGNAHERAAEMARPSKLRHGLPPVARCAECGADAVPERADGKGPRVVRHAPGCSAHHTP